MGAEPTIANDIPSAPDRIPFTIEYPARPDIRDKETTTITDNSSAPNTRATLPKGGDIIINAIILINPPKKEETIAKEKALPASPLRAIGYPSNVVAIEEG